MLCENYWNENSRDMKYIRSTTMTLGAGFNYSKEGKGLDQGNRAELQKCPGRRAQGMGHVSPSCSTARNVLAVKHSMDGSYISCPK